MSMMMCRSCGEFLLAIPDGDGLEPQKETCPECGGTKFKDNHTGQTIDTRDE